MVTKSFYLNFTSTDFINIDINSYTSKQAPLSFERNYFLTHSPLIVIINVRWIVTHRATRWRHLIKHMHHFKRDKHSYTSLSVLYGQNDFEHAHTHTHSQTDRYNAGLHYAGRLSAWLSLCRTRIKKRVIKIITKHFPVNL